MSCKDNGTESSGKDKRESISVELVASEDGYRGVQKNSETKSRDRGNTISTEEEVQSGLYAGKGIIAFKIVVWV